MVDLFGNTRNNDKWIVFHDESFCEDEKFLYHGLLFVRRDVGRTILDKLLVPDPKFPSNYDKRIHFCELTGWSSSRSHVARHWIKLAKDSWLCSEGVKFYCLGVDLKNINQRLYSPATNIDDAVYRRFYEISLKGALAFFGLSPDSISHLYYDQGKLDIDRYNKTIKVCGKNTVVQSLSSDCTVSKKELSKFLQLTDVLLGSVRKSFAPISPSKTVQAECVRLVEDLILRFNNPRAYNKRSRYWKRFCLNFFPRKNNLTPDEFFNKDIEYYKKTIGAFYSDRPTHLQMMAKNRQQGLGF